MVTGYDRHWDGLREEEETYYPETMLKGLKTFDYYKENVPTTFVKLNTKDQKSERAWKGSIYGIRKNGNRIYFKVKIDSSLPNVEQFLDWKCGWYIKPTENPSVAYSNSVEGFELQPPIFNKLLDTDVWEDFEDYTYYLIRLLGIHSAYKFYRKEQAGRADGFFKFKNLAVIYDCTLYENGYEERKKEQIANYCNQIESGFIEFPNNVIEKFPHHNKQVWLITRGQSRLIRRVNEVLVKEVCIKDLISLYLYRLENMIGEGELENKLRNISSIL
jgi:hypothetical protein